MNQMGFNIRDMLNESFFDIRGPTSTLDWVGRRFLDEAKMFFYLIGVNCSGYWGVGLSCNWADHEMME